MARNIDSFDLHFTTAEGSPGYRPGEATEVAITVPVPVDAERMIGDASAIRVTYFVIASDSPIPGYFLRPLGPLPGAALLNVLGVVYAPLGRASSERQTRWPEFESRRQIEALFELETATDGILSVQLEDLWLPTRSVQKAHRGPMEVARGDVYRVELAAFHQVYRYANDEISFEELDESVGPVDMTYSEREASVFAEWEQHQIAVSIENYPNKVRTLRYREGEGPRG